MLSIHAVNFNVFLPARIISVGVYVTVYIMLKDLWSVIVHCIYIGDGVRHEAEKQPSLIRDY